MRVQADSSAFEIAHFTDLVERSFAYHPPFCDGDIDAMLPPSTTSSAFPTRRYKTRPIYLSLAMSSSQANNEGDEVEFHCGCEYESDDEVNCCGFCQSHHSHYHGDSRKRELEVLSVQSDDDSFVDYQNTIRLRCDKQDCQNCQITFNYCLSVVGRCIETYLLRGLTCLLFYLCVAYGCRVFREYGKYSYAMN